MHARFLFVVAALFSAVSALTATAGQTLYYQGTIGDHLTIELQLTSKDDGKFAGSYRYANYGQSLALQQTSEKDGVYKFRESVMRDGKVTGSFRGKFSDDSESFTGTWSSKDGKRSLPFDLHRVAETVELAAGQSDRYDVRVAYPKFNATNPLYAAVNEQVRKEAQIQFKDILAEYKSDTAKPEEAGPRPYQFTTTVEVLQATDKLVSVLFQDWEYTGGAHGNSNFRSANYIWRNGKMVEVSFGELIGQDSAVAKRLGALCVQSLKRQNASSPDSGAFDLKSAPIVNVTPGGLLFSFSPYEVGSYAEGSYSVLIPFSQFREQLNDTSVLASAK